MVQKMKIIQISLIISALVVAFAIGRYTKKPEIITQVKIQEIIKEKIVKDTNHNQKNDRQTHTIITEKPDGTKITEIWEVNKDTIVIHTNEVIEKESKKKEEIVQIIKTQKPQWLASGGYGFNLKDKETVYTIEVSRRILGPVFIGLEGNSNQTLSGTITVEF